MTTDAALRTTIEDLFANWNTHDPNTFAETFSEDAEFTDIMGNTAKGRDAIAEQHVKPFGMLFQKAVLSLTNLSVKQLTDEVVSASAHWAMLGHVSPQGEPLPERRGILHVVLVWRDKAWYPEVVHNTDHTGTYQGTQLGNTP